MADFNLFSSALQSNAQGLAGEIFGGLQAEAAGIAMSFISKSEDDLKIWTELLQAGELTQEEFKDLMEAKEALVEIEALTSKGMTLAQVERFRQSFMNTVMNTAFKMFMPI